MKVYHQIFLYDKNEKFKRKTRRVRSRSFLKPFLYSLCPQWGGTGINTIDIDGTGRNGWTDFVSNLVVHPGRGSVICAMDASRTNDTASRVGIVVGSNNTAVAITDYKLNTKIANGTGAGQLIYLGCWVYNLTTGASSTSFDIERIFYNGSGGNVAINEIGIDMTNYTIDSYNFCMIRDVLGATVTVADTEYCKVKYTITVSV